MASYRCYLLTKENKIGAVENIDSKDDASAMLRAPALLEQSVDFPTIEIWRGGRIVGRIPRPQSAV